MLFLDIAGYTQLSEQLEPRRLNQLVQTYFSSFLEIIQRAPRRRERDGGRRPHGDLPGRSRQRGARPRAQRHPRRLRHPPAHDRAQRGVRRRLPADRSCTWASTPARRWWAPPSSAAAAASAGRSPPPAPPPTWRRASPARPQGGEIIVGPDDRRAHPRALRAGEPGRAHVQERLAADPGVPRHPAGRVREDRLSACAGRVRVGICSWADPALIEERRVLSEEVHDRGGAPALLRRASSTWSRSTRPTTRSPTC